MKTLLILLLPLGSLFAQVSEIDSLSRAVLVVEAASPGLPVWIDETAKGVTPISCSLSPGQHHVRVASPLVRRWGAEDFQRIVTLTAAETLKVIAHFSKMVVIQTIPFGAAVYLDEVMQGYTPLTVSFDARHQPLVRLEKEGFEPVCKSLTSAEPDRWLAKLVFKPSWLEQQRLDAAHRAGQLAKHRRLFLLNLAISTLSGLATIYFRDQGNQAFQSYQTTASPGKMDHFFKRAQKFDRLAGGSYAMFEISFVLSGYHFLASRK